MGKQYYGQIDTLRFIAVLLVLIEHFATAIGERIHAGFFGVTFFFVISGFLITNILLNSDRSLRRSLKLFFGRRVLRIVPVYYLLILVLYIAGYEYVRLYLWSYLLFVYNYASVYYSIPLNFTSHLWTIAVEEQFYLLWPFIVLPLRGSQRVLALLSLIIIAVCGAQILYHVFPSQSVYWTGIFPQAYFLVLGGLGAIVNHNRAVDYKWLNVIIVEIFIVLMPLLLLLVKWSYAIVIAPIFLLLIVLKIVNGGFRLKIINSILEVSIFKYVGRISYGVYLYHLPVAYYAGVYVLEPLLEQMLATTQSQVWHFVYDHNWVVRFPLYSGLTILLAHVSYKYFESPFLKLKDYYFKK